MSAALAVVLAWLLFGGSHLALSSSGLRDRSAERFGRYGFVIFYTALSVATLFVLGIVQVGFGASGAPGPDLGRHPASGFVLTTVSAVGCFLMVFGFLQFGRSGMAQLSAASRSTVQTAEPRLPTATGVFKVSRHPFFMGLGLLMAAHAAMATTRASLVFFAGFAILAAVGTWLLDRKLTYRHGKVYRDYMARTTRSLRSRNRDVNCAIFHFVPGAKFWALRQSHCWPSCCTHLSGNRPMAGLLRLSWQSAVSARFLHRSGASSESRTSQRIWSEPTFASPPAGCSYRIGSLSEHSKQNCDQSGS